MKLYENYHLYNMLSFERYQNEIDIIFVQVVLDCITIPQLYHERLHHFCYREKVVHYVS